MVNDMDDIIDMEAYTQVDDEVIGQIMKMSPEVLKSDEGKEDLRKAKEILERVEKRQIYRCLLSDPVDSKELKVLILFISNIHHTRISFDK